jgi:DnaJ-class molecular chaperone
MSEKIIICPDCKGSGKYVCSKRIDDHKRWDIEWDEVCKECGGTGRLVETIKTTYRKLTPEELSLRLKPRGVE